MKLSEDGLVALINLMLNTLEYSRWVVLEIYDRREQLDTDTDSMTKLAGTTLGLAVAKAKLLDKLSARGEIPMPNKDGLELIEFWLELDKLTRGDQADDT